MDVNYFRFYSVNSKILKILIQTNSYPENPENPENPDSDRFNRDGGQAGNEIILYLRSFCLAIPPYETDSDKFPSILKILQSFSS
jgi:hypothetical protein